MATLRAIILNISLLIIKNMEQNTNTTPAVLAKNVVYAVEENFKKVNKELDFIKEAGFALQAVSGNSVMSSNIQDAGMKTSLQQAIYNVALTGLSLNPVLKLAYLVPRKKGGQWIACLDPSYQGLVNILIQTKQAKDVFARVVYENDEFDFDFAKNMVTRHRPFFMLKSSSGEAIGIKKGSGEPMGVYAAALLPDGTYKYEFMEAARVESIRSRSEGYKAVVQGRAQSSIWTGEDRWEMWKKTAIKAMFKTMGKTNREMEVFATAIDVDNDANGIDFEQERKDQNMTQTAQNVASTVKDTVSKLKKKTQKGETVDIQHEEVKEESNTLSNQEKHADNQGTMDFKE